MGKSRCLQTPLLRAPLGCSARRHMPIQYRSHGCSPICVSNSAASPVRNASWRLWKYRYRRSPLPTSAHARCRIKCALDASYTSRSQYQLRAFSTVHGSFKLPKLRAPPAGVTKPPVVVTSSKKRVSQDSPEEYFARVEKAKKEKEAEEARQREEARLRRLEEEKRQREREIAEQQRRAAEAKRLAEKQQAEKRARARELAISLQRQQQERITEVFSDIIKLQREIQTRLGVEMKRWQQEHQLALSKARKDVKDRVGTQIERRRQLAVEIMQSISEIRSIMSEQVANIRKWQDEILRIEEQAATRQFEARAAWRAKRRAERPPLRSVVATSHKAVRYLQRLCSTIEDLLPSLGQLERNLQRKLTSSDQAASQKSANVEYFDLLSRAVDVAVHAARLRLSPPSWTTKFSQQEFSDYKVVTDQVFQNLDAIQQSWHDYRLEMRVLVTDPEMYRKNWQHRRFASMAAIESQAIIDILETSFAIDEQQLSAEFEEDRLQNLPDGYLAMRQQFVDTVKVLDSIIVDLTTLSTWWLSTGKTWARWHSEAGAQVQFWKWYAIDIGAHRTAIAFDSHRYRRLYRMLSVARIDLWIDHIDNMQVSPPLDTWRHHYKQMEYVVEAMKRGKAPRSPKEVALRTGKTPGYLRKVEGHLQNFRNVNNEFSKRRDGATDFTEIEPLREYLIIKLMMQSVERSEHYRLSLPLRRTWETLSELFDYFSRFAHSQFSARSRATRDFAHELWRKTFSFRREIYGTGRESTESMEATFKEVLLEVDDVLGKRAIFTAGTEPTTSPFIQELNQFMQRQQIKALANLLGGPSTKKFRQLALRSGWQPIQSAKRPLYRERRASRLAKARELRDAVDAAPRLPATSSHVDDSLSVPAALKVQRATIDWLAEDESQGASTLQWLPSQIDEADPGTRETTTSPPKQVSTESSVVAGTGGSHAKTGRNAAKRERRKAASLHDRIETLEAKSARESPKVESTSGEKAFSTEIAAAPKQHQTKEPAQESPTQLPSEPLSARDELRKQRAERRRQRARLRRKMRAKARVPTKNSGNAAELIEQNRDESNVEPEPKQDSFTTKPSDSLAGDAAEQPGTDPEHKPSPGKDDNTTSNKTRVGTAFKPTDPKRAAVNVGTSPFETSETDPETEDADYVALTYQICESKMEAALQASSTSNEAWWSYDKYASPTGEAIALHYCRSKQTSEKVAQLFAGKATIGCDIEWSPRAKSGDMKQNVSLIQIACEDRIALFHIALHKGDQPDDVLSPTLKSILESPDVLKCGVNIQADFTRMRKHLGIDVVSLFELSHLHRLVQFGATKPHLVSRKFVGLAEQTQTHLGLPLFKGDERVSDWSQVLNWKQCKYAADDAYASYRLFEALKEKWYALDPRPPFPACAELGLPIQLAPVPASDTSESEEDDYSVTDDSSEDEVDSVQDQLGNLRISEQDSDSASLDSYGENVFDHLTEEQLAQLESSADNEDIREIAGDQPSQASTNGSDKVRYPVLPEEFLGPDEPSVTLVGRLGLQQRANSPNVKSRKPSQVGTPERQGHERNVESPEDSQQSDLRSEEDKKDMSDQATGWAQKMQASHKHTSGKAKGTVTVAALRAYYLWEHQKMDPKEIAQVLRTPPLKTATVTAYVAECLQFGKMEWSDLSRLQKLVKEIPLQARGRYWRIRQIADEAVTS